MYLNGTARRKLVRKDRCVPSPLFFYGRSNAQSKGLAERLDASHENSVSIRSMFWLGEEKTSWRTIENKAGLLFWFGLFLFSSL